MRFLSRLLLVFLVLSLSACGGGRMFGRAGGGAESGSRDVSMSGGARTRPDAVAEKYIFLQNQKGDEFRGVFERGGVYDATALRRIDYVFRDVVTNEVAPIAPELIDYLVDIRARLGLAADVEFEILSGYRNPRRNAALASQNSNVALESFHPRGLAVDFRVYGAHGAVSGKAIAAIAKTMQRGGVSFYPRTNHVHVDLGGIRTWRVK